jgi:hypothetical protein
VSHATATQLHDAMPDNLKAAVLLGAFCGLRVAEVSGLRVADVDFMRCVVSVRQQWDDQPLKSTDSKADIPIPRDLANMLNASVQKYPSEFMVTAGHGTDRCGPWLIQRAVRESKADIDGSLRSSVFTICGITMRACLSRRGRTSKPSRSGCGTPAHEQRSTSTAICGRAPTTRHAQQSQRRSRAVKRRKQDERRPLSQRKRASSNSGRGSLFLSCVVLDLY